MHQTDPLPTGSLAGPSFIVPPPLGWCRLFGPLPCMQPNPPSQSPQSCTVCIPCHACRWVRHRLPSPLHLLPDTLRVTVHVRWAPPRHLLNSHRRLLMQHRVQRVRLQQLHGWLRPPGDALHHHRWGGQQAACGCFRQPRQTCRALLLRWCVQATWTVCRWWQRAPYSCRCPAPKPVGASASQGRCAGLLFSSAETSSWAVCHCWQDAVSSHHFKVFNVVLPCCWTEQVSLCPSAVHRRPDRPAVSVQVAMRAPARRVWHGGSLWPP